MHSDVYVPVRPGTDGALMLAMANHIIENGLMDEEFMRSSTVSPFLVKEDGTYLHMSDLGTPATEGPVDPRKMCIRDRCSASTRQGRRRPACRSRRRPP